MLLAGDYRDGMNKMSLLIKHFFYYTGIMQPYHAKIQVQQLFLRKILIQILLQYTRDKGGKCYKT